MNDVASMTIQDLAARRATLLYRKGDRLGSWTEDNQNELKLINKRIDGIGEVLRDEFQGRCSDTLPSGAQLREKLEEIKEREKFPE